MELFKFPQKRCDSALIPQEWHGISGLAGKIKGVYVRSAAVTLRAREDQQ